MKLTRFGKTSSSVSVVLAVAIMGSLGCVAAGSAQTDAAQAESGKEKAESEESKEVDLSNTLKWATASEVDNFGYDVFRSESEDGPFERINPDMIPGAGTTDEVSRYEYRDSDIDPFSEYYYYVESVSMSGVRERFTPVQWVAPKLEREPGADAEEQASEG